MIVSVRESVSCELYLAVLKTGLPALLPLNRDRANLFELFENLSRRPIHLFRDSSLDIRWQRAKLFAQVTVDDILDGSVVRSKRHVITPDDRR